MNKSNPPKATRNDANQGIGAISGNSANEDSQALFLAMKAGLNEIMENAQVAAMDEQLSYLGLCAELEKIAHKAARLLREMKD